MKKMSTIILAGLFLFMMSCNNDEEGAEEAAENLVEGLFENATGGDIDINVDKDGESVEMTIGGEEGVEISINEEGKEIPDNLPKGVYLIKGDIESVVSMDSGEGEIITIVIFSEDSFKDVVSEITKEMKANGWKSTMNMNMGGEAMQMYSKDKNSVTITINGKEEKVEVAYIVTVAKK